MSNPNIVALEGSRRIPLPGAKALGPTNPNAVIDVLVKVRRKKAVGDLHTRPEPIGREGVASTYGASAEDIDTVAKTFEKLGLQVVATNPATRTVELSGSAEDIEQAFQVKLFNYEHPDGNYRGRVGEIFVPASLKDLVTGVFGLDDRRVARRRRRYETHKGGAKSAGQSSWYVSNQLGQRYSYPAGDGAGQAVGLLEFGGGYFRSDLAMFCQLAKVPEPTVKAISVDGTSTSAHDGAEGEVMLDVEVVAGLCPKSTICVYFAHWSEKGWIQALDATVNDTTNKPSVVSASWGNPEDVGIWTHAAMTEINETLKDAAMAGMTVCIAAGDDGSSDADMDGHAHVDFPAASPYVVAVGGTAIPKKGRPLPDIVWFEGDGLRQPNNPNSGATGGGVSAVFPRPSWQQNITIKSVNPGAIVGRVIPDVAADADWTVSPYLLVVDGQAQPNGGTSAASPLVAALIVLINGGATSPVGYLTPLLYQPGPNGQPLGASVCKDVVSGKNTSAKVGGYSAGPGYDAASGWGTPIGTQLAQALSHSSAQVAAGKSREKKAHA